MTDTELRAAAYLAPTVDSVWRWSADGEVLTWADGRTIAFRPEVRAVLARLAPHGLPAFGAVALVLAACREGWDESGGRDVLRGYGRVFGQWQAGAATNVQAPPAYTVAQGAFARAAKVVDKVLDGLEAVGRLPAAVREKKDGKAALVEAVFEVAPKALTPDAAAAVVQLLEDGVPPEGLLPRLSTRESLSQFADDVDALRPGLAGVDERSLARSVALRTRTGLDELPKPAPDLDLGPSQRVWQLLAELRQDKELAGLARLAQDLMAAVHVPRALHARDELPLGGVSDLSNRGPLDRLLVSELAHDDLTLAVRVATNEALFLRRETPPRQPPSRRAVLIDCGVRMWGIPRVYAAAVALALAATTDKKADVVTYRATDAGGVEPVDLTTRDGLVDCLAALAAAPHPGKSLRPFFDRLAEKTEGPTDALVVTHPDVLADAEFGAAMHALDEPALYVATVARDGAFRLTAVTAAGGKPVREAVLSLEAILNPDADAKPAEPPRPAQPGTPLRVKEIDPALPVILSADPFPLRLPYVVEPRFATVSRRHGLVAATKDGRLLQWDRPDRGARQLTALLPRGQAKGVFVDDDAGTVAAVLVHRRIPQTHLITADLATGRCSAIKLEVPGPEPDGAAVHRRVLYLIYAKQAQVDAYDLNAGRQVGRLELPVGAVWHGGRYVYTSAGWQALAFDGWKARLERVPTVGAKMPAGLRPPSVLFDREGHDGPMVLVSDGTLLSDARTFGKPDGDGCQVLATAGGFETIQRVLAVGLAGGAVAAATDRGSQLLSVDQRRWEGFRGDAWEAVLVPQIHWSTRSPVTTRSKFRGVFPGARGELWLRTFNGTELMVGLNDRRVLTLVDRGQSQAPPGMREFTYTTRVPGARYDLTVAGWADGSRAFLDSRGMLHLKSAAPAVPEVTLVLANDRLAGWATDGTAFGPPFFFGDPPPVGHTKDRDEHFADLIRRFTARLR